MDFFGIGTGELLLVLVIALIIWGPGKMIEIGRTLGKAARTMKKISSDLTAQITEEIEKEELDKEGKSHLPQEKQEKG